MEEQTELPREMNEFLMYIKSRGRKESTIKRYRYDLADFYRFVRAVLDEKDDAKKLPFQTKQMEAYLYFLQNERQYEVRTWKRIFTVLKQYTAFLRAQGRIKNDPFQTMDLDASIVNELTPSELIHEKEERQLYASLRSDAGLSDRQKKARPMLAPRNICIIHLFLQHGLRLQELASLTMGDVNRGTGDISIPEHTGNPRKITLSRAQKNDLFYYLEIIPKAVRPYKESDPLFVAFDFQRQTYRWSYEDDAPKNLTEIAIQKMIREERKRANIHRPITARHLRNTFIVRALKKGWSVEQLSEYLGLQTELTLTKYIHYVEKYT